MTQPNLPTLNSSPEASNSSSEPLAVDSSFATIGPSKRHVIPPPLKPGRKKGTLNRRTQRSDEDSTPARVFESFRKAKEECEKEKVERLKVQAENQRLKEQLRILHEGRQSHKRKNGSEVEAGRKRARSGSNMENITPPPDSTSPPEASSSPASPTTLTLISAQADTTPWHEDEAFVESISQASIPPPSQPNNDPILVDIAFRSGQQISPNWPPPDMIPVNDISPVDLSISEMNPPYPIDDYSNHSWMIFPTVRTYSELMDFPPNSSMSYSNPCNSLPAVDLGPSGSVGHMTMDPHFMENMPLDMIESAEWSTQLENSMYLHYSAMHDYLSSDAQAGGDEPRSYGGEYMSQI